jgi:alpha-L-fucosidase
MNRRSFISSTGALLATTGFMPRLLAANKGGAASDAKTAVSETDVLKLAPRFGDGRDWWFEKRFGMFVHWGLYSIHAWQEQEQWRLRVPRTEYEKLQRQWNPVDFNPDHWLDHVEAAGMKYLCFTTKHHDGFCLWDTKQTSFNTMNTPYGKDVLKSLAEACHRRKFPLCLYYSVLDWHKPNFPNLAGKHGIAPQPGDVPDWSQYHDFLKAQVQELCTNYGEIHGFWWDGNWGAHKDPSINPMIRQLQPKAVINDRGLDAGDFGTPERDYIKEGKPVLSFDKRTEACQAIGMESWGWRKDEDYYSDRYIYASISRYLARDANYLLNVGPLPSGALPREAIGFLKRIGRWYGAVKEAFEGTMPASHLTDNRDVLLTRRRNMLYVIQYAQPLGDAILLKPLKQLPKRATLLNTGADIRCSNDLVPSEHLSQSHFLRLTKLPVNKHADTVLVVRLEFDQLPEVISPTENAGAKTG